MKNHLPHRNVPVRTGWLKNKGRRKAEEVLLLALPPIPLGQITSTSFLIYEMGITAHFYFTEIAWGLGYIVCKSRLENAIKTPTTELLSSFSEWFPNSFCSLSPVTNVFVESLSNTQRERWVKLLGWQIINNSGNWTQCPPSYLSVPLRALWHPKTVLPNSLATGFCWRPDLHMANCMHTQSRLVFSKGGQQQRNTLHLQQT